MWPLFAVKISALVRIRVIAGCGACHIARPVRAVLIFARMREGRLKDLSTRCSARWSEASADACCGDDRLHRVTVPKYDSPPSAAHIPGRTRRLRVFSLTQFVSGEKPSSLKSRNVRNGRLWNCTVSGANSCARAKYCAHFTYGWDRASMTAMPSAPPNCWILGQIDAGFGQGRRIMGIVFRV